jgi:NADPH2:quinone reductase
LHIDTKEIAMQAWLCENPIGVEALQWKEMPTPEPAAGQVRIAIRAASLNFPDLLIVQNKYQAKPALPFVPGSEYAGVVEAVGAGVVEFKVGDRVAWCAALGSYSTHVLVAAEKAVPVPEKLETRAAAAAMLQGLTAHYLATATVPLEPDDAALVHAGAGGVGLLLTQIAKKRGARVVSTVGTDEKAALSVEAGPDELVVYTREDFGAATAACARSPSAAPWSSSGSRAARCRRSTRSA